MSLPHYLTFFRLFVGPLFIIFYGFYPLFGIEKEWMPLILLVLIILAELSDLIDGYLARKLNQVTDLGKILDPLADSLTHFSVFAAFTLPPISLPMPLIVLFFYRDACIGALRTVCASKGFILAARNSGKLKAVIQGTVSIFLTALLIFYFHGVLSLSTLQELSFYLVSLAAFYTVVTALDYFLANQKFIKALFFAPAINSKQK